VCYESEENTNVVGEQRERKNLVLMSQVYHTKQGKFAGHGMKMNCFFLGPAFKTHRVSLTRPSWLPRVELTTWFKSKSCNVL